MANVRFQFKVDGTNIDFRVISFHGRESISGVFQFDIDLVSADENVDFDGLFNRSASLTIGADDNLGFHGVVASLQQTDTESGMAMYRVVLAPRLWYLGLNHRCCIHQEVTVPEIVSAVLKEHNLSEGNDFSLRLSEKYPKREYVVQYQETDLNFVSRWLEHEGILYFYRGQQLVFADRSAQLEPIASPNLPYRVPSGLETSGAESVQRVSLNQQMLPSDVLLKDYNWRKPQLELKTWSKAAKAGRGRMMEYGNHYKDDVEGKRLARVRGEEIRCRQRQIQGQSDCPRFRSGFRFTLEEHPRLDGDYLLTEVVHHGAQTGAGASGTEQGEPKGGDYGNQFVAIPAKMPFRPLRKTPKPKLYGTMNAKVDGAGSGQYAEIDEQGRYKVIMPFDVSGKGGGQASRFIRMAQPYGGSDYGMHFPLHKGIEVIWSCIDGDPDRPIICGAVPNPDTASPVTQQNHTKSIIRDYGGNEIVMEGLEGARRMHFYSPTHATRMTLGASATINTVSEIKLKSDTDMHVHVVGDSRAWIEKNASQIVQGDSVEEVYGNRSLVVSGQLIIEAGSSIVLQVGPSFISIGPDGIAIEGPMVNINCGTSPGPSAQQSGLVAQHPTDPEPVK